MPDDILDIVKVGIEVAKTAPKARDNVQAKDIPPAKTAEDVERNKRVYDNVNNDIAESLAPGERFLTETEAKERRERLIEERKKNGLNPFD